MSSTEIIPGVHAVRGKFAGEFGFIASYLIVDEGEILVIDPGTAGDPGNKLEKSIKNLGLNPKTDVKGILCTHGHPDHVGGAGRLKKITDAPVMIHEEDAEILVKPGDFLNKRLILDKAQRFAMKLDKGPLRVNFRGLEPDELLTRGMNIEIGSTTLKVIHTGGHSAGHCVFYDSSRKALFSGDEVNNFPNDPRKFYIDTSGSIVAKLTALEALSKLGVEYLFPAHDSPHIFGDVGLQFESVRDGIIHLQDIILTYIRAREEADVEQLVFDINQSRSVSIPMSLEALLTTTVHMTLLGLKEAGLVRSLGKGVWTRIGEG
ncbi:MAG: MBL fold metallo-hydrolase [Candidatus Thorarchaeota archaeon]